MKKVISIILVLGLCLSSCFVLTACSEEDSTVSPEQAAAAESYFFALMESYNGLVLIKGSEMNITDNTTIQDVIDFIENEGQVVIADNLDTSRPFLSACQQDSAGHYTLRTDVDWRNFYKD